MKKIPLSQGKFTLVDDEDYERLSQWKWHLLKCDGVCYAGRRYGKLSMTMHRQILNVSDKNVHVDHKNGDGLDNRRENLRKCTSEENRRNRRIGKNNTSGYKGVSYVKSRDSYAARIMIKSKSLHLGYYVVPLEAAIAYNEAAIKYHGEFARLNVL